MKIVTDRLCLREVTESDYDFFAEFETNESCIKYKSDTIHTKDWIDKKFSENLEAINKLPRVKYRLMLSRLSTNELVGRIVFWKIDDSIKEWEIGWDVQPKYWGNGYATEAGIALLKFAFNDLKVHRIRALCNDKNYNSEKVMIKIGMKKEGTSRDVMFLNNHWYGSHIYSLLESEFNN